MLGLSLAGAALLWLKVLPTARAEHRGPFRLRRGLFWCFGASLERLLPAIVINAEFAEFFNDPERRRLKAWQSFLFTALGVFGWLLGGALIATVAGLTHSP